MSIFKYNGCTVEAATKSAAVRKIIGCVSRDGRARSARASGPADDSAAIAERIDREEEGGGVFDEIYDLLNSTAGDIALDIARATGRDDDGDALTDLQEAAYNELVERVSGMFRG